VSPPGWGKGASGEDKSPDEKLNGRARGALEGGKEKWRSVVSKKNGGGGQGRFGIGNEKTSSEGANPTTAKIKLLT